MLCVHLLYFLLPWQDVCWSLYVGRDFCVAEPIGAKAIPMLHIDPELDEMAWFYPPAKIAPQPSNLTKTFEATCRLLMIARRIMDVMWVHGVDSGFAPLTGVSLVISNGLNKARSRPLVLDTLISDIEYAFSYDHCFCRWPQSKRPVKHVEKLSTRRTWDYSQVETHCDPTQVNASFGLLVAHYPAT